MADQPNLVFIFSDQQRQDTLACYGNDWTQPPAINTLADHSFVFQNAYVTQPVCTPARASIMTGLYPHAAGPIVNKVPLPPDVPTIAEMVSDDYLCGYFGKWHLGDDLVAQHGFDRWISTEDSHRDSYRRSFVTAYPNITTTWSSTGLRQTRPRLVGLVPSHQTSTTACRKSSKWDRSWETTLPAS